MYIVDISFYSCVAVFIMSVVSTAKKIYSGVKIDFNKDIILSLGSLLGGVLGNFTSEYLLNIFKSEEIVQWIQIILTILSLLFAFLYTNKKWKSWNLKYNKSYFIVGLFLGFLSTLLGIGGGPINAALIMLCFGTTIKDATVYSIIIVLFSQLSKLVTLGFTVGYNSFESGKLYKFNMRNK